MRRREFITLVGGAATWPLAARAESAAKSKVIGLLGSGTTASHGELVARFVERLRELGWTEGRDLIIEYRWAEGRQERAADIAAEFVRLDVDVIFVTGGPGVFLAKKATSVIPIVVALASDPVGTGLVASFARPGGNVTGLSMQSPDLVGKRLDLLRDVAPNLRRLGILYNSASPSNSTELNEVKAAAEKVKLDPRAYEYREAADFPAAFDAMKGQVDAVRHVLQRSYYHLSDARADVGDGQLRMPTIYDFRDYVVAGGLMSYGANFPNLFRRSAEIVNKIFEAPKLAIFRLSNRPNSSSLLTLRPPRRSA